MKRWKCSNLEALIYLKSANFNNCLMKMDEIWNKNEILPCHH